MRKKVSCIAAAVMSIILSTNVYAEEELILTLNQKGVFEYNQDSKDGVVAFGDDFSNMLPGETRTATMSLHNECELADFYISTETIDAFENSNATNGAYDLTLVVGDNTIYDSSLGGYVTGTSDDQQEGLKQINDSLSGYVYAVTLDKGESANVLFSLTLDGESVSNGYMGTNATIHFDYQAVYKTSEVTVVQDEPTIQIVQESPNVQYVKSNTVTIVDSETARASAANTGDTMEYVIYGVIFVVAVIVCILTKKKKQTE